MLEEPEDNRLDQSLRDTFSEFDLPPADHVWTGIEQRLASLAPPVQPARRRRPVPLPFWFALVALLAGIGGWLLPHPGAAVVEQRPMAKSVSVTVPEAAVATQPGSVAATSRVRVAASASRAASAVPLRAARTQLASARGNKLPQHRRPVVHSPAQNAAGLAARTTKSAPLTAVLAAVAADQPAVTVLLPASPVNAEAATTRLATEEVPGMLHPLVAVAKRAQAVPSVVVSAEAARAQQIANLRAQRAELLRLQIHTDSLLVVLGDVPVALPMAAAPAAEPADTAKPQALSRRWSLQLAAAPEQNALTLEGPEDDKLISLRRGYETGRPGVNAHLLAEYQLSQRLSLGAGLGYSAFGAQLRINTRRTEVDVDYRTTSTTTLTAFTSTNQTYSIRITQVPMLNPIFNSSGQVLGYDTVYTARQDTLFTTTVLHDTVRTTVHNTTPILTRREVISNTTLRPNYHFATLPVLLRYRITPFGKSRWWTDVALGAQVQLFLGGTQAVTDDGVNFRTESISAGAGPFRAVNLALSGSLALNYALTNRLSVSAAPSMRWQALSLYKAETGLKQQPTATGLLMGVRWRL